MLRALRHSPCLALGLVASAHAFSTAATAAAAPPSVRPPRGTAIVTGGSRGIGAACCREMASRGYSVVVVFNSGAQAAEGVVSEIVAAGGSAIAMQADVGDEAQVSRLFASVDEWRGKSPLTALVNNAGVLGVAKGSLQDATTDALLSIMRTNVAGPLNCLKEAEPRMASSGGGAVVQISSGSAYIGTPLLYAASKGALNSLTIGLIKPLAQQGIRINTVSPGMTNTDMIAETLPTFDMSQIPLGRVGTPEDIAHVVCWLCSDEAAYVAGANVRVAGGRPPGTTLG
mmetsp:Transcript_56114/g.125273  ORF Transcript_56114/g.125273 Transcript_56114/m.125273 type:complete len:286 (-) Transcript_56114:287-1144(-)